MQKKTDTIDRFKLSCECEVSDLGAIIAQLTKMGLTNLHFELMTEVSTFRQKTNHTIKAEEFLTAWIADHPTFAAREAIAAFRADGRTDGAGYSALRALTESNTLKKLAPGNYARADVKALAAPKKKKAIAKPSKHVNAQRYALSNSNLILRVARRKHGRFKTMDIKNAFAKDGRNRSSASPAIFELLTKKLISRIGDGEYQLTADGAGASTKTNSNGTATEGVING